MKPIRGALSDPFGGGGPPGWGYTAKHLVTHIGPFRGSGPPGGGYSITSQVYTNGCHGISNFLPGGLLRTSAASARSASVGMTPDRFSAIRTDRSYMGGFSWLRISVLGWLLSGTFLSGLF